MPLSHPGSHTHSIRESGGASLAGFPDLASGLGIRDSLPACPSADLYPTGDAPKRGRAPARGNAGLVARGSAGEEWPQWNALERRTRIRLREGGLEPRTHRVHHVLRGREPRRNADTLDPGEPGQLQLVRVLDLDCVWVVRAKEVS